jgi:hypothetical protein
MVAGKGLHRHGSILQAAAVLWVVHVCTAVLVHSRRSFIPFFGSYICNISNLSLQIAYPSSIQVELISDPRPSKSLSKPVSDFGWFGWMKFGRSLDADWMDNRPAVGRSLDKLWIPLSHSDLAHTMMAGVSLQLFEGER